MGVRRLMEFLGNVVPFVSEMPKVQNTEGKEVAALRKQKTKTNSGVTAKEIIQ